MRSRRCPLAVTAASTPATSPAVSVRAVPVQVRAGRSPSTGPCARAGMDTAVFLHDRAVGETPTVDAYREVLTRTSFGRVAVVS